MMIYIAIVLVTAGGYFYYNLNYFNFVRKQKMLPRLRVGFVILSFLLNYTIFVILGALQFHLIMNWFCFAILLFFETLIYTKGDRQCALFSTLMGIIHGLAINIFCRSAMAIITGESLRNFDNHIYSSDNLKSIPVFIGFVLAGAAMQILSRQDFQRCLGLIMKYRSHQSFLLELLTGLFFYLFLNLLIYSTPVNDLLLKGWSIKSSLFSLMGFFVGIWYTWRICVLAEYREMNRNMEHELKARQQEEPRLLQKAIRDPLTGLYNRQHAMDVLTKMMHKKLPMAVCFVDLDGLKEINDHFGHAEGDRYIWTVTDVLRSACRSKKDMLFRYGGDEFLVLCPDAPASVVERRMEEMLRRLADLGQAERFRRTLSFSYGVVDGRQFSNVGEMIQAADQKMYRQKKGKKRMRS